MNFIIFSEIFGKDSTGGDIYEKYLSGSSIDHIAAWADAEKTFEDEISSLITTFNDEFFTGITPEGGSEWDAFIRFAQVVKDSENFMADLNRQIEEFGETTVTAFQNLEGLSVITSLFDMMELDPQEQALKEINDQFDILDKTLEDLNATSDFLTRSERLRAEAIEEVNAVTLAGIEAEKKKLESLRKTFSNSFSGFLDPIFQSIVAPGTYVINKLSSDADLLKAKIDDLDLGGFGDTLIHAINEVLGMRTQLAHADSMMSIGLGQASLLGMEKEFTIAKIVAKYQKFVPGMDLGTTAGQQGLINQAAGASYEQIMGFTQGQGIGVDELFSDMSDLASIVNDTTESFSDLIDSIKDLAGEVLNEKISYLPLDRQLAAVRANLNQAFRGTSSTDPAIAAKALKDFPAIAKQFLSISRKAETDMFASQANLDLVFKMANSISGVGEIDSDKQKAIQNFAELNAGVVKIKDEIRNVFQDPDAAAFFNKFEEVFGSNPFKELQGSVDTIIATIPEFPTAEIVDPIVAAINNLSDNLGADGYTSDQITSAQGEFKKISAKYGAYGGDITSAAVLDDIATWTADDYAAAALFTPWPDTQADIAADVKRLLDNRKIAGYAGGGVASGPNSGYLAILHGTERVIPSSGGGGNDDLVKETRSLKEKISKLEAYNYQITKFVGKTYDIFDKWDANGIPAERTA